MVMTEVLAFDCGDSVVGILDVNRGVYLPYLGKERIKGAKRLVSHVGTIVSFNGSRYDLPEISKMLSLPSVTELHISGEHNDMSRIVSEIRWPPDPGTAAILGQNLDETYRYYFGDERCNPPPDLRDKYEGDQLDYIIANWRDCYMTAELWKRWRRGKLGS